MLKNFYLNLKMKNKNFFQNIILLLINCINFKKNYCFNSGFRNIIKYNINLSIIQNKLYYLLINIGLNLIIIFKFYFFKCLLLGLV